jgi:hypothetical protein
MKLRKFIYLVCICLFFRCVTWTVNFNEQFVDFSPSVDRQGWLDISLYKYKHKFTFITTKKTKQWTDKEVDSVGKIKFFRSIPNPVSKDQETIEVYINEYHFQVKDTALAIIDSIKYDPNKKCALVHLVAKKIGNSQLCAINYQTSDTICSNIKIDSVSLLNYSKLK